MILPDSIPYKLAIIDSGYSKGGDVRSAKKLARFSFYEQMLHNAIELGIDDDARIYMDELNRNGILWGAVC